jgi:hypothetical protein
MPTMRLLAATTLALALACSGLDDNTVEIEAPVELIAVEPIAVEPATLPPGGQIGAYLADCAAPMMVEDEMEGGMVSACGYLEFDQMCSPDITGCWDKREGCNESCVSPCQGCESSCVTDCGGCKSTCGDDAACLQTCAETRLSCQESCLTSKEGCLTTCGTEETACYDDFQVKLAEVCPACDRIRDCLMSDVRQTSGGCQAKFPSADARCFSWCDVY